MKSLFASFALLGVGLAGGLDIGVVSSGSNSYSFSCAGAQGAVNYYLEGLPSGVNWNGSTLSISNAAAAGNHSFRVRAVDANGQSA